MGTTENSKLTLPRLLAWGGAAAALSYGAYVATTWAGYGRMCRSAKSRRDEMLDRFMPKYEVAEHHDCEVDAPANVALAAAYEMDLQSSPLIRLIFKGRELVMGGTPGASALPHGLIPLVKSLGWGVLDEKPGREIVVGAITQPWLADVVFHALPAEEFAAFAEPGYVKIAWTLRVDPAGPDRSVFRTDTRAIATDPASREKFRVYWACVSPGVWLIRRLSLPLLQREAAHRAQQQQPAALAQTA